MKKILSIVAVAALMFTFASCQKEELTPAINLDKTLTMYVGQEKTLVPTFIAFTPLASDLSWTSADSSIVTIDSTGKVTALKVGKSSITVTYDKLKLSATCDVEVTPDVYLYIEKTALNFGDSAAFELKSHSGKTLKSIKYNLYYGDAVLPLADTACRKGQELYGYIPGVYRLYATYLIEGGSETVLFAEAEYSVAMPTDYKFDFTPSTDVDQIMNGNNLQALIFTSRSMTMKQYENGKLVKDSVISTLVADSLEKGNIEVVDLFADKIMTLSKYNEDPTTDKYPWKTSSDGKYLYTGTNIDEGLTDAYLIAAIVPYAYKDVNYQFIQLGPDNYSTLSEVLEILQSDKAVNPFEYAFGKLSMTTHSNMMIGYTYTVAAKDGVPAHTSHVLMIFDGVCTWQHQDHEE